MLNTAQLTKPMQGALDNAYRLCLAHASIDQAFSPELTWFWFLSALETCADFVGWTIGEREITEPVYIPWDGNIRLSAPPNGPVEFFSGAMRIAVLPAFGSSVHAISVLCCQCNLEARYTTGQDLCALPAGFLQAVARLFTYIAENRGDTEMDSQVLSNSGAKAFLMPWVTLVA